MTTRTISHIELAGNASVGQFPIKDVLPTRRLQQIDPFLLIHHMRPFTLKAGEPVRLAPHPHAGFEVVTYLLDGEFFHRDSKGHDQVASAGDVNWMSSAAGLLHSEGPTEKMIKDGGKVQLLQIWINLPAEQKKKAASFTHYPAAGFPELRDGENVTKVIIGDYQGRRSPVSTHTPMFLYHIKLKKDSLVTVPVPDRYTSAVYIMQGKLRVLGKEPVAGELVNFHLDGDQVVFTAAEDTELIFFGGQPINEKVVSYGPFIMNSFSEIQEAIADYEQGKMGILEY